MSGLERDNDEGDGMWLKVIEFHPWLSEDWRIYRAMNVTELGRISTLLDFLSVNWLGVKNSASNSVIVS